MGGGGGGWGGGGGRGGVETWSENEAQIVSSVC